MPLLEGALASSSRTRDVPDCGKPPTNTNACLGSSASGKGGGTGCSGCGLSGCPARGLLYRGLAGAI